MKFLFSLLLSLLGISLSEARVIMYYDQWHPGQSNAVSKDNLGGVTHVILAFMLSHHLNNDTIAADTFDHTEPGHLWHKQTAKAIRDINKDIKIMLAIGGWNDDPVKGWRKAIENPGSMQKFANNIKSVLDTLQLDGVDIDWEYPGGNAVDYLTTGQLDAPAVAKEINGYIDLLKAIKTTVGSGREVSIAVPGKPVDMMAFNDEANAVRIYESVDFVNIMTYDMTNRRDDKAGHHTSFKDALATVDTYTGKGLAPEKAILGFAFYAKWFTVKDGCTAAGGLGCSLADLEDAQGGDTGLSGSMTFEAKNVKPSNKNAPIATEGKCGPEADMKCASPYCCSNDGWCGNSPDHCGYGKCDPDYSGDASGCKGPNLRASWQEALSKKVVDADAGGVTYVDTTNKIFWTWDSTDNMQRKLNDIVSAKKLGGVMAWSYGEENFDTLEHLKLLKGGAPSAPPPANGDDKDNVPTPSSGTPPLTTPGTPSTLVTSIVSSQVDVVGPPNPTASNVSPVMAQNPPIPKDKETVTVTVAATTVTIYRAMTPGEQITARAGRRSYY